MFLEIVRHKDRAIVARAYKTLDDLEKRNKPLSMPYAAWGLNEDMRTDQTTINYFAHYGLDITSAPLRDEDA